MWSKHQPSPEEKNRYIKEHGLVEYEQWRLGMDEAEDPYNRVTISSHTEISSGSTGAVSFLPKYELDSTNTALPRKRLRSCTACSIAQEWGKESGLTKERR